MKESILPAKLSTKTIVGFLISFLMTFALCTVISLNIKTLFLWFTFLAICKSKVDLPEAGIPVTIIFFSL